MSRLISVLEERRALKIPFDKHPDLIFRLIRVELPTGETEVLLTTLTDTKRYLNTLFKELYHRRWGVETCLFSLKSLLQIVRCSAIIVNSVWQDLYTTFIIYNLLSAIHRSMEKDVERISRRRQAPCQPNPKYQCQHLQILYHPVLPSAS